VSLHFSGGSLDGAGDNCASHRSMMINSAQRVGVLGMLDLEAEPGGLTEVEGKSSIYLVG
jgi:hypothetical protein